MNKELEQKILSKFDEACMSGDFGGGIDVFNLKQFILSTIHEVQEEERKRIIEPEIYSDKELIPDGNITVSLPPNNKVFYLQAILKWDEKLLKIFKNKKWKLLIGSLSNTE